MDRIWLEQYPPGVPADIAVDEHASINSMFERACADFSGRPAFTNMGATLSYAQMEALSRAFAVWLQTKSGLKRGDRVALMMPNILQYPIALFGVLRAGMVVVNTNPLYTARELEHQLQRLRRQGHRDPREFRPRAAGSAAAYRASSTSW